MAKSQQLVALIFMMAVAVLSVFAALSFGAANIPFFEVVQVLTSTASEQSVFNQQIIWQLRMPRTLLAFLAGSGLAISGLILQTVTRNPLADPYLFGISSGASFGVVILVALIGSNASFAMSGAAFIGSLAATVMLLFIAGNSRHQQVETMLLAGVALSFLFSSLTSFLLYLTDPQAVTAILFWTMGSFTRAEWQTLWAPAVVIVGCTLVMIGYRRQLNAMLMGDESATTLGINVKRFRITMLLLSSLITAVLVSMCGGIGFVGLMIPHIVRFFVSQGSGYGMLLTAGAGGIFMVWVDVLARIISVSYTHLTLPTTSRV